MKHSIKEIADNYEKLSVMRKDKNPFNSNNFFKFVKDNIYKYNIIGNGEELFVSTWYSDSLIMDYKSRFQIY